MKKKLLLTLMATACALTCAFGLTACGGGGGDGDKSGYLTFMLLNNDTYSVYECDDNAEGQIEIPSTFNNKSVTSINVGAFSDCVKITGVTIPGSVKCIEFGAFSGCSELTSITASNGVTSIQAETFRNCTKLENLTIPNSVTSIGTNAFDNTAWYDNQPDGLVYAGKVVYSYKGELSYGASIPFEDETYGIADRAFTGSFVRDRIREVTIPDGVITIGEKAFDNCLNLYNIIIPDSVTRIGQDAFNGTRWLKNEINEIIDGEPVYLGKFCVAYKSDSVHNVTIKVGTRHIADGVFELCDIGDVTMPDGLISIGKDAFSNSSLGYVYIPSSVTSIGEQAFASCQSVNIVYDGTKEQWNAIEKGKNWDKIKGEYYTITYGDSTLEHIDKK